MYIGDTILLYIYTITIYVVYIYIYVPTQYKGVHLVGWRHTGWDEGTAAAVAEFPLAQNVPGGIVLLHTTHRIYIYYVCVCVYRIHTSGSSFVVIHFL